MTKKVLLGLTSISKGECRNKVKEIDELGLKEIALFPTCLNASERQEIYQLLEKTKLERIPHVHLKGEMGVSELDYLTARYKTKVFNVHSDKSPFPPLVGCEKYYKKIYVENIPGCLPTDDELKKYAGLCIDVSHWESIVLENGHDYKESIRLKDLAGKHKIGCNHISAVKKKKYIYHDNFLNQDIICHESHWLDDLSELDYVKKYKNYLTDTVSIELENTLKRQLDVKQYLEKILL